ncbi:MAG: hydrogenase maturation nickel metallochaperone HypA [Bacteroidales bacterium]|nr:hydrogenase maturation nickel metallochaperone HypA [Bacteroidales bacterium]
MHELSIAMNILEIVDEEVKKAEASVVRELELDIGQLSGVVIEALEFALTEAVKDSVLEKARIIIHEIPATVKCNECQHEFGVDDLYTPCPSCHSFDTKIIKGGELRIRSLLVD